MITLRVFLTALLVLVLALIITPGSRDANKTLWDVCAAFGVPAFIVLIGCLFVWIWTIGGAL